MHERRRAISGDVTKVRNDCARVSRGGCFCHRRQEVFPSAISVVSSGGEKTGEFLTGDAPACGSHAAARTGDAPACGSHAAARTGDAPACGSHAAGRTGDAPACASHTAARTNDASAGTSHTTARHTVSGAGQPMRVRHSVSLVLIWRLAELEARQLNACTIEAAHLLLGLCKSVDVDLTNLVRKDSPVRDDVLEELLREVRRLRTIFQTASLDARAFRRALRRKTTGTRLDPSDAKRLRRSKVTKQIFADAEHFAEIANSMVFPVHLLYAILLTKDIQRDDLLERYDVAPSRLRKVTQREVIPLSVAEGPASGLN
jgi:hypothetical protein